MAKRKKRENTDGNYVDNARLRELIVAYNDMNPNDNGDWLDKYEHKMKATGKYESVRAWIALRRDKYSRPRKSTPEFEKVSEELFCAINEIADHRVRCFNLPAEEIDDIRQECVLAVLTYVNRYREDLNSSAFAWITQVVSNTIKLYMGRYTDSMWCRCPWNDISDTCMALMYGSEGDYE